MNGKKVRSFMELAGQRIPESFSSQVSEKQRTLGAQLLLSEVLEYVIHGLGVTPEFNGTPITDPNDLRYEATGEIDEIHMLDGLADTAYTMYWNAHAFAVPLEEGFELVCDNNLEKFVELENGALGSQSLDKSQWHCNKNVEWPESVKTVDVIKVDEKHYAVGKDASGKVRKPSSYQSVDLRPLLEKATC